MLTNEETRVDVASPIGTAALTASTTVSVYWTITESHHARSSPQNAHDPSITG